MIITFPAGTPQLLGTTFSAIAFGVAMGLMAAVISFAKYGEQAYAAPLLVGGVCSVSWWWTVRWMTRGAPA